MKSMSMFFSFFDNDILNNTFHSISTSVEYVMIEIIQVDVGSDISCALGKNSDTSSERDEREDN